ncbi:hypothetical protein AYI69_g1988 [Smittium culicis]|uniref:RNI-like protein n=2 Tax=Smittium culicis TaxID=133412 RepID=A0A1R1YNP4_9FUNG|nr:hypothetical protein AYI69_g1988 [Smittium culicis]
MSQSLDFLESWVHAPSADQNSPQHWPFSILNNIASHLSSNADCLNFALTHPNWLSVGLESLYSYPKFSSESSLLSFLRIAKNKRSILLRANGYSMIPPLKYSYPNHLLQNSCPKITSIYDCLFFYSFDSFSQFKHLYADSKLSDPNILVNLARACTSLSKLSFYAHTLNDTQIITLTQKCHSLKALHIVGFPTSNANTTTSFFKSLKSLKSLTLNLDLDVPDSIWTAIQNCSRNLVNLDLHVPSLTPSLITMLHNCSNLSTLKISGQNIIFPKHSLAKIISNNPKLSSISLQISEVDVLDISSIFQNCFNLTSLELICPQSNSEQNYITLPDFDLTFNAFKIQHLIFDGIDFTKKTFGRLFSNLKFIKTIVLANLPRLSPGSLTRMSMTSSSLVGINIHGCLNINDSFLNHLADNHSNSLLILHIKDLPIDSVSQLQQKLSRLCNVKSLKVLGEEVIKKPIEFTEKSCFISNAHSYNKSNSFPPNKGQNQEENTIHTERGQFNSSKKRSFTQSNNYDDFSTSFIDHTTFNDLNNVEVGRSNKLDSSNNVKDGAQNLFDPINHKHADEDILFDDHSIGNSNRRNSIDNLENEASYKRIAYHNSHRDSSTHNSYPQPRSFSSNPPTKKNISELSSPLSSFNNFVKSNRAVIDVNPQSVQRSDSSISNNQVSNRPPNALLKSALKKSNNTPFSNPSNDNTDSSNDPWVSSDQFAKMMNLSNSYTKPISDKNDKINGPVDSFHSYQNDEISDLDYNDPEDLDIYPDDDFFSNQIPSRSSSRLQKSVSFKNISSSPVTDSFDFEEDPQLVENTKFNSMSSSFTNRNNSFNFNSFMQNSNGSKPTPAIKSTSFEPKDDKRSTRTGFSDSDSDQNDFVSTNNPKVYKKIDQDSNTIFPQSSELVHKPSQLRLIKSSSINFNDPTTNNPTSISTESNSQKFSLDTSETNLVKFNPLINAHNLIQTPGFSPSFMANANQPFGYNYNPNYRPAFNPGINPALNPNFRQSLFPGFMPNFNPLYNPMFNPMLNPNYVQNLNPNLSSNFSPSINHSITPATQQTPIPKLTSNFNHTPNKSRTPNFNANSNQKYRPGFKKTPNSNNTPSYKRNGSMFSNNLQNNNKFKTNFSNSSQNRGRSQSFSGGYKVNPSFSGNSSNQQREANNGQYRNAQNTNENSGNYENSDFSGNNFRKNNSHERLVPNKDSKLQYRKPISFNSARNSFGNNNNLQNTPKPRENNSSANKSNIEISKNTSNQLGAEVDDEQNDEYESLFSGPQDAKLDNPEDASDQDEIILELSVETPKMGCESLVVRKVSNFYC